LPVFDPTRANEIDGCVPVGNILTAVVGGVYNLRSQQPSALSVVEAHPHRRALHATSIIGGADVQKCLFEALFVTSKCYPEHSLHTKLSEHFTCRP
jgi:hypothetical protein